MKLQIAPVSLSTPHFRAITLFTTVASMQSICLYSSSPKSTIVFDFFSHGFHTTDRDTDSGYNEKSDVLLTIDFLVGDYTKGKVSYQRQEVLPFL